MLKADEPTHVAGLGYMATGGASDSKVVPEDEPNNTPDRADAIEFEKRYLGGIFSGGWYQGTTTDTDYYSLTIGSSKHVYLLMLVGFESSSSTSMNIALLDGDGNTVKSSSDGSFLSWGNTGAGGEKAVSFPTDQPLQLVSIDRGAFSGCSLLTALEFPKTLRSIDFGAFYGCIALKSIKLNSPRPVDFDNTFHYSNFYTPTTSNGAWIYVPGNTLADYHKAADARLGKLENYGYHICAILQRPDPVPIYRMYNYKTSEHLYTKNVGEFNSCGYGNYRDWQQENVAWNAPASSGTPVYRLYNPVSGDHHYTTGAGERDVLVSKHGWHYEGIEFYSDDARGVPLYRVYNGRLMRGQHHYTSSMAERNMLTRSYGWSDEKIGFYGVK